MLLALGVALGLAAPAGAATSDAERLAERFAPLLELKRQTQPPCDTSGEQFVPSSVDLVLGRPQIVLRRSAPDGRDPAPIPAPTAADLRGKGPDWFLDLPGNPYEPGCTFARDAIALGQGEPPVVYAHLVAQPDAPGRLALQYWFFYYFNQFNDTHEGDWEMVQLLFDADTPAQALEREPTSVGYSQHDAGERAGWDADKLEREGDRIVVYPAAGSHANYYSQALWLGRSASEGFGCDDTREPSRRVVPEVRLVDDRDVWLTFEGNWGQKARGLFDAPTGPNTNRKWSRPIDWDGKLRDSSIAVPAGGALGVSVIDFFCQAVSVGSGVYSAMLESPLTASITLLVTCLVLAGTTRLTRWSPAEATPLVAARANGQVLRAARRIFWHRRSLFVPIGLLFVPVASLGSAVQVGLIPLGLLSAPRFGDADARLSIPVAAILGGTVILFAERVMTAATAHALHQDDRGRAVEPLGAYRALLPRWRSLLGAVARAAAIVALLFLSIVGIPWAIRQAVRWVFIPQVCAIEGLSAADCLSRSSELVRGRWWRTALLVLILILIGLVPGLLVGLTLLLLTPLPLPLVNFVGALFLVAVLPYAAVALTLAYGARVARGPAAPGRRWWRRGRRPGRAAVPGGEGPR